MAHSVKEIIAAFQDVHAALSGVNSAGTQMPSAIDTEDCPLAMTLPGEAVWADNPDLIWERQRQYNIFVYVAPIMQDMPHEGMQETFELMDTFGEGYLDNPTLGGVVFETVRVADRGYSQLAYNGVNFHGFTFLVTVNERC